ncbi:uncharacterized protein AC631_00276 [Debaryomyces fabryi]|uniref:protein-tyrosine-phosphatase n=1 Tax=Debaryomyces fabryi TaxID=58627 RepID=A0A0V1Q6L4_9ASCO|nr:uncharacterized protein AC631_00276 [Debaryomyces fabryi]KSA04006.1 hypothetical protein AC631_00276 [Debaryomyces fabryi]CUM53751.1 unnamed protein product [Debaryomyces fabryi]
MIYRILGGIYLSSIEPLNDNVDFKQQYHITHIISAILGPIPNNYVHDYVHKQIDITDEETSNIIQYFPETNDFIDSCLFPEGSTTDKHHGAILIHCAQGISRSVTLIVAYLMYRYKLTKDQALHAVKRKLSSACPNDGFQKQLQLYADLKFKVDTSNSLYKKLFIDLSIQADPSGRSLQELNMFSSTSTPQSQTDKQAELRCKKCRQVLALEGQIEKHSPPDASSRQSQFIKTAPNSRRIVSVQEASDSCSHYFVREPLTWMRSELEDKGEIEGKFNCPKCDSKVGGYSWKGSRCSCGKWMIPALHLQCAKVDNIKSYPTHH